MSFAFFTKKKENSLTCPLGDSKWPVTYAILSTVVVILTVQYILIKYGILPEPIKAKLAQAIQLQAPLSSPGPIVARGTRPEINIDTKLESTKKPRVIIAPPIRGIPETEDPKEEAAKAAEQDAEKNKAEGEEEQGSAIDEEGGRWHEPHRNVTHKPSNLKKEELERIGETVKKDIKERKHIPRVKHVNDNISNRSWTNFCATCRDFTQGNHKHSDDQDSQEESTESRRSSQDFSKY